MKSLYKQQEAENRCDTKTRRKEPRGLSERIHEKNRHKDSNRTRKGDSIVRSNPYESCNLKLTQHKTYKTEGSVERHKSPESPKLDPADEISLSFRTPKE